jgi:hypothetical protein
MLVMFDVPARERTMTKAEGKGKVIDLKALSAGKSSDCSLYQRKISVLVMPNQYIAQRLSQC